MSPGDVISLVALVLMLVVCVPVIAFTLTGVHKRRLAFRERQLELTASQTAEKAALYAANVTELEERLRVLERIVTDKGYDVSTQIEALRDNRKVEALVDNRVMEARS